MNVSSFWSSIYTVPAAPPRVAFTDSSDDRVLRAVADLSQRKLVNPVLVKSVAPSDKSRLANLLFKNQKKPTYSVEEIASQLEDTLIHGIALLLDNQVEGLVGGATRPTADIVKAALHFIGPRAGQRLVSGQFLVESETGRAKNQTPFLFSDCAVMPEPSPRSLALIALAAADAYKFFTKNEPRVALLSFSTRGSAAHELVDRIREAVEIVRKQSPAIQVDGEIQVDAALDFEVAKIKKADNSSVAGQANVLVFPTLEAGNISYKLVQRFSNARVAGPFLWGLDKPLSDLSRGCTVQEISDTTMCLAAMIRGLN